MIEDMKAIVNGEKEQEKTKKPVKAQDLVRLYESVIQNLNEMPQMAGLEDDLAFRQQIEVKVVFYKAFRLVSMARNSETVHE